MSDLFSNLYRYRQREKKNNYEDWLTECLAAILRALPKDQFAEFISQLTGQPAEAIAEVHKDIEIATQVTIEREITGFQRPDLIISIAAPKQEGRSEPSQPWLLFENKVAHHVDEQKTEAGEVENQLHRYGYWLKKQKFDRLELTQALLFVTHRTPAPADFMADTSKHPAYMGMGRNCSSWGAIAFLLENACADLEEMHHCRVLVTAYQSFLEDHGMDDAYPEYRDFAALANYIEVIDPFTKLVNEMFGKLDSIAYSRKDIQWAEADSFDGTFSTYRFLAKTERYDEHTFISTGVWFPDRGEGLYAEAIEEETGVPVSFTPKLYIQFANSEDDALTAFVGKPNSDWYRLSSDFFIFRDVASFPSEPSECATAVLAWVEAEGANLKALLSR